MTKPNDGTPAEGLSDSSDDDDRVGEAVEVYLLANEQGQPPALDDFVARYPGLEEDVRSAIEGLELVHGLLGLGSATGSGSDRRAGLDQRIESGRRIAGYRVVRELGRGGMGTVYEAVHVGLDRPVALKVLGVHAAPDSSARRRFLNEARTAAGLHHTHIVPVFDVGQVGGLCYYAMQRIEGSGLDRVLKHLRRTRQVASGVGEAISGSRLPKIEAPAGPRPVTASTSRVSRLWGRVPSAWRRGHEKTGGSISAGAPGRSIAAVSSRDPARLGDSRPFPSLEGSTGSWGTGAREAGRPNGNGGGVSLPAISKALPGLTAVNPEMRRHESEAPPFDPPRGPSYFRWVAKVGIESADALAHAHQQGVIHRDVKPSNLLIDAKGSIWVTDFGLARRLADPGITHHDSLLGTPRYMSPEQARTGAIDGRTDVYSLGATLYELLTLHPPFDGQTAAELIDQIGGQEPVPPTQIDRRVPRDLETIALKALAKRPADRYATAADLVDDLGRFLNREPVKARRIGPIGRAWRVARRHPGITAVSTTAAAIVLAVATFAYVRVVSARDHAIEAGKKTVELLAREKEYKEKERAARKDQLRSTIELVGLGGAPNRRSYGLERIKEAASLDSEVDHRTELRDWAVKFLVLREIETGKPELATGRSHGLIFTPAGHRLAVLSEAEDELAFWDLEHRRQLAKLSLRGGSGTMPQAVSESSSGEVTTSSRSETTGAGATAAIPGSIGPRSGPAPGMGGPAGRPGLPWLFRQRLAQIGPYVATLLPEDKGLGLIDLLSGTPLRVLDRPDHTMLGILGESTGRRLVTIELVQVQDDAMAQSLLDRFPGLDAPNTRSEVHVNLWDPDHLDRPIAKLPWRVGPPVRGESYPLVAISPDGKNVAVASHRGMLVKIFSARDGKPLKRRIGAGPGPPRDASIVDLEIEPQAELSALALGPNNSLATAGNTSGGVAIRIWDLDSPSFLTSLNPPAQSYTRLMRFSPQGNLLAIMGNGPIELWDPVALNLVAVLTMSDQPIDVAFAPDGKSLAAVGRAGEAVLWTVHDSTARTQLSGFDTQQVALAFSNNGVLAGVGRNGEIWSWRSGRCPEIGPPAPASPEPTTLSRTPVATGEKKRSEPFGVEGQRPRDHSRGREGARPQRRGPPPSLAFDATGRMVFHDAQGLRVYPSGSISTESPPAFWIAGPVMPGNFGPGRRPILAKTPDGRTIAVGRASAIYLWHAETPGELVAVDLPARPAPEPAAPTMNGARRQERGNNEISGPIYRSIQIAPRGDRLYAIEQVGPNSVLRAWAIDAATGSSASVHAEQLDIPAPLAEGATILALRPDGNVLAFGDRTGRITLLDTTSWKVLDRLNPPGNEPENYWSPTPALTFSPDGRELAVGSQQGTIALWSLARPGGSHLHVRLPGHRGWVTSLAYEPDGRRLACTSSDPIVEVWDLEVIEHELTRLGLAD